LKGNDRVPSLIARMTLIESWPAAVVAVGLCACGSHEQLFLNGDDEGGSFQGSGADAANASSLAVSVTPPHPLLCPGQCVALSAQAAGGKAPYRYRWDDGLASDGGEVSVCPGATTTYNVTATDSSGTGVGELQTGSATGSASVTATVTADCDAGEATAPMIDAGARTDAGPGLQLLQIPLDTYTGITVGLIDGSNVYRTNWTSAASGTVSGVLSPPAGDIQVTYTASDLYGTGMQTPGANFWLPASTYTSATVPDAPPGSAVEIAGGASEFDSITFSEPVTDPIVAIFSLGASLPPANTLAFKAPFTVLSSGPDVFGGPTGVATLTVVDGGVSSTEGSGVVQVMGTF
jgi:hypothetical protein